MLFLSIYIHGSLENFHLVESIVDEEITSSMKIVHLTY